MKGVRGVAALAPVTLLVCLCGGAEAYRPFDGTDAAVAETGEMEIELGPVEYLRDRADRSLFAPDVRINYGFTPGWEASLEGDVARGLTTGTPVVSLVESEALLKGVLRAGSLQEKPGPSIASAQTSPETANQLSNRCRPIASTTISTSASPIDRHRMERIGGDRICESALTAASSMMVKSSATSAGVR